MSDEGTWWDGYFDDTFVDLYRDFLTPQRTALEVQGLREMLDLEAGARVLDVACGWGRHTLELAAHGARAVGVDFSPRLLSSARRRAEIARSGAAFLRGDMRALPFAGGFDVVLSLFSSLGYFESADDDLAVLRGMHRALRPGGRLVVETMHRDHLAGRYADRDWWETESGTMVWVEREFDAVEGVSREWTRWRRGGKEGEKFHRIRLRTATEWDALLRAAGFQPLDWYGDYELAPFVHTSETLLVVARRTG